MWGSEELWEEKVRDFWDVKIMKNVWVLKGEYGVYVDVDYLRRVFNLIGKFLNKNFNGMRESDEQ